MAAREEKGSPSFLAEIAISRASANTFFHREEKPKDGRASVNRRLS